jgi:hypothetical protein
MDYHTDCELLLLLIGWVIIISFVLVSAGCMFSHLENMVIVLSSYLHRLYVSSLMLF